ncbi:MAG: SMC family ATPase [Candidatus Bathyarchaeota archaeon]|nr:SMC family ATPase [Candidatus Bathyarchaeota archaeon]
MKIEIVQLENIRSHVKSTVPFSRGFNCLVGGLGCGKSSVLYSIDFAFFGDPIGRSFEYLLREGADSGKVTVQFTHNGNTYKITRGIKRRGKGINQDLEELKLFHEENLIASMNASAIAEQFCAITGLDKELWREIVWIRQEQLKKLIDAAPRDRQKLLDELFGLSDYEAAWSSIVDYQREYEGEKRILEKDPDVIGKEKLALEYNRITEEYTLLEVELQSTVAKLAMIKRRLEAADVELKKLDEKKLWIEELRLKEAKIQANISNAQDAADALAQRLEDKKIILENLNQRLKVMHCQIESCKNKIREAGLPIDQPTDALQSYLLTLDSKISDLRGEQEATLRDMKLDQKRLAQLSVDTQNQCPVCLQPINSEYKKLMLQRIQHENSERQKIIHQLQREIEELQRKKRLGSEACSDLQMYTFKVGELKTRIGEEEKNLQELQRELEEKKNIYYELSRQLESLRFEISRFNMEDLEVARTQKEQLFRQYYLVESELRTKENRKRDALQRLDEIKERIDHAMQKMERLEKITKTIQIIGTIRYAYRGIQPKLRGEFVKVLRNFIQQVLDTLIGNEAPFLNVVIDETYTPYVKSESGADREVANLSGGERTLLAFAYRLGLGQLIMQSRTGHGLGILLLDEPTENLGAEDYSINHLAEAISKFKAIEQIIAVTHSEVFAEKAEHVVVLEKEAGISKVSIAKEYR